MECRVLSSSDLPRWMELLDRSPHSSVFARTWWTETVTMGLGRILGVFKEDLLVAGVPISEERFLWDRRLVIPPFTAAWGPVLRARTAKPTNADAEEMKILRILAVTLRQWPEVFLRFPVGLDNWLPFYWEGFKQTTRYTYRLNDLSDLNRTWKNTRENIRSDIRKAQRMRVRIDEAASVDAIMPLISDTLRRNGVRFDAARERLVRSLDGRGASEKAWRAFYACDPDGRFLAGAVLVWDSRCAYYILGGGDATLRRNGATSLLLWEMIRFASEVTNAFDFEGSMVEPIEHFFRGFGGERSAYNIVWRRSSALMNSARSMQRLLGFAEQAGSSVARWYKRPEAST